MIEININNFLLTCLKNKIILAVTKINIPHIAEPTDAATMLIVAGDKKAEAKLI